MKWALIGSLGLNLALAGLILGAIAKGPPPPPPPGGLWFYGRSLPEPYRGDLGRALRDNRGDWAGPREALSDQRAAFAAAAAPYGARRELVLGGAADPALPHQIAVPPRPSPLDLMARLAAKLALNTISTGTMVRMGRVAGNWMSHVSVSNKKLLDRGIRLVAELRGLEYAQAAREIFAALDEAEHAPPGAPRISPVQRCLAATRRLELDATGLERRGRGASAPRGQRAESGE